VGVITSDIVGMAIEYDGDMPGALRSGALWHSTDDARRLPISTTTFGDNFRGTSPTLRRATSSRLRRP
jgi:hypothetical protein